MICVVKYLVAIGVGFNDLNMPIMANIESSFKRCADALPFEYNISHIAPLAPRGESGIRLTLYLPPLKIIP